jgi:hypothetical protein
MLSNFVSSTGPHCSRGVQPGGICAHVVHRDPPDSRGSGSGEEGVLIAAILSARGTHTKSVLGIQLVKVKYFFYPVWIRKKPAASLWSPLLLASG